MISDILEWNTTAEGMVVNDTGGNTTSADCLSTDPGDTTYGQVLWSSILAGIALCVIIMMTICGNILVIVAIVINPHLRITTNYFILNLAIADLLLGTTVLPFSASLEVVNHWIFGQFVCNIWAALDVLCCTASIMSLCVISIDRYIGVTRPLQHSNIMTEKRGVIIIIVVWVLATAISVAPLAGWKEPPPEDHTICEVTKQLGYVLFSVSGSFYIPLIIILVVYYRVYREASKQSRFLSTGTKTTHSDSGITLRVHTGKPKEENSFEQELPSSPAVRTGNRSATRRSYGTLAGKVAKFKREKKAAKTLGIVVGVFIMCWFPFFFILPLVCQQEQGTGNMSWISRPHTHLNSVQDHQWRPSSINGQSISLEVTPPTPSKEALCTSCHIPVWLFKVIFWLGYCNSTMNPIIYACSSREFKRAFIRVLLCRCRRRFPAYITNTSRGYRTESRLARMKGAMRLCSRGHRVQKKPSHRKTYSKDQKLSASESANKLKPQTMWSGPCQNNHMVRKETMDSLVISDDESAIHELSSDSEADGVDNGLLMCSNTDNNNYQCHMTDLDAKMSFRDVDAVIYRNRGTVDVIVEDTMGIGPRANGIKPQHKKTSRSVSNSDSELYNRSHMYICSQRHKKYSCNYSPIKQEDADLVDDEGEHVYTRKRLRTVPSRQELLKEDACHIEVNPDLLSIETEHVKPSDSYSSICASQKTILSDMSRTCDSNQGVYNTEMQVNSFSGHTQNNLQGPIDHSEVELNQGYETKKSNYVSVPVIVIDKSNGLDN